jgi:CheY-like chemotaxis protein
MARILVVDDNHDCSQSLAALLRCNHHEAIVADSGIAAIGAAETAAFDLVLLDLLMPGMDGFEVARQLRRRLEARCPRIVALTGYHSSAPLAGQTLFDAVLMKPAELEKITALIPTSGPAHLTTPVSVTNPPATEQTGPGDYMSIPSPK